MSESKQAKSSENVRLDKWLWAARFFKTRAIARDMVQSGKVQYNGQRAKPSRQVEVGALIKIPAGWDLKEVEVLKLSEKRLGAPLAQELYSETQASVDKREENQLARKLSTFHSPKPDGRPDKKQRREIIKLKHS
ncbi:ribosome-associated heat shock protein Hsp15 [Salinimonas sp. HHU 13199]|uniref:Heat shock protein 15 n=1 Tax=Salinimonas profundi TaxID=2729140 RepID=A0ABR8LIT8_9ALTE|nr:ribosome-associated heat shock protein Hsp15 [Salinimonas profundi]MBD3585667.1 ribosome-associated heat shock protein Hsp15 [Salinimonas profundi]